MIGDTMNIKRKIARWLGYGGIEWPKSAIVDLPIKFIDHSYRPLMGSNVMRVHCYPGGVQILPGEIGCDGKNRLLLSRLTLTQLGVTGEEATQIRKQWQDR